MGVATFVLKYRLPNDNIMDNKETGPLQDAQQAIKLIRSQAKKWNIDTAKVGVIGFSAGGHLASTLGTQKKPKEYGTGLSLFILPNMAVG